MEAEKYWQYSYFQGPQRDLVHFVGCRQPEASAAGILGNQTVAAALDSPQIPAAAGEILGVVALLWERRTVASFAAAVAAAAVGKLAELVPAELESRRLAGTILLSRYNYPTTKHPSALALL